MTVAMLMRNTVTNCRRKLEQADALKFGKDMFLKKGSATGWSGVDAGYDPVKGSGADPPNRV